MSKLKVMVVSPELLMGALVIAADVIASIGQHNEIAKIIPSDPDRILTTLLQSAEAMELLMETPQHKPSAADAETARKAAVDALQKAQSK